MHNEDEPIAGREPSGDSPPAFQAVPIGREAAPVPPAEAPPSRQRSRRKWLYFAAILLLGTITTEPGAASLAERRGEMFGGGIALLFMSIVAASLLFAWRRSTRTLIPGAALVIAVIMVPAMRAGDEAEAREQFAALQSFADSLSDPADTADGPPRGNDARMLWATRKAMEDMVVHYDALARSHGVDPDHAPEAWLSAAYLADAGRHPEVGSYFTRYQAYVREADSTLIPVLTRHMRALLVQSGLGPSQIEGFMRGFDRGAARRAERQQFASMLELGEKALELDAYLARVDSRVHLDERAETALFDREAERLHVNGLLERLDVLGQTVEAQQRASGGPLKELGRMYGIEADTAGAPATPDSAAGQRAQRT